MLVHCCDRWFVYKKEIQPCRTKYRGIWAILMHKMMFPSESCNSVSNGRPTFCEFRLFSAIAENHWPYVCVSVCLSVCVTGKLQCKKNVFVHVCRLCVFVFNMTPGPLDFHCPVGTDLMCVCVCVCVCVC